MEEGGLCRFLAALQTVKPAHHHQDEQAARATLVAAIMGACRLHGVRGDDLVARHAAARGRADAAKSRDGLAAQLAGAFRGDVLQFCHAVRGAVPSAKPSRMPHPEGMTDPTTRGELRAGNLARWGWDRLFAVANSLGYDVVVTLRPRGIVTG
ncbi:hypothetical protein [Methylobacterium sp. WL116]|uniref:hypothetical protein n=1 Tax=Methylobacterium sp. WL116 TaxID=2603889 RepID=UPI0011CA8505|nr:hypothetical protein [Methylobacterium sp. WL116]TXM95074.1 hypothetical protein FV223_02045 [Methylobacterium sp. WL116]